MVVRQAAHHGREDLLFIAIEAEVDYIETRINKFQNIGLGKGGAVGREGSDRVWRNVLYEAIDQGIEKRLAHARKG